MCSQSKYIYSNENSWNKYNFANETIKYYSLFIYLFILRVQFNNVHFNIKLAVVLASFFYSLFNFCWLNEISIFGLFDSFWGLIRLQECYSSIIYFKGKSSHSHYTEIHNFQCSKNKRFTHKFIGKKKEISKFVDKFFNCFSNFHFHIYSVSLT